jgi:hypothetical protein
MSNIVNYTDYNTYFAHPIPFFKYIKELIFSQETHSTIIYKIQNLIHNIDNGMNGYIFMEFNTLTEFKQLKNIITNKQSDLDKIICLKLFFTNI